MRISLKRICAVLAVLLTAGALAAVEAADDGTIRREGWSFDRSELNWAKDSDPEKEKAAGTLNAVTGWTEYDFEVPATGWYELWQEFWGTSGRNVDLDSKPLFRNSHTPLLARQIALASQAALAAKVEQARQALKATQPEKAAQAAQALKSALAALEGKESSLEFLQDGMSEGGHPFFKEANLWLSQGKHTLRYERWEKGLPHRWKLCPAKDRPEACIRSIAEVRYDVVRGGEPINFTFLGGAAVPLTYDLVLRSPRSEESIPVGRVEFPANPGAKEPLKCTVNITFPKEGEFLLLAKVGDKLLRPADIKGGCFTVIDTKAPPAAKELKTTPQIEIDCVAQTLNGKPVKAGKNYFEKYCRTTVVTRPFGSYRESTPDASRVPPILEDGKEPTPEYMAKRDTKKFWWLESSIKYWGLNTFAYKFDLPEVGLYRLQVDYPDDERRTMGFHLMDFPPPFTGGTIQGGGVETGDHYPLSHTMKTHESYFFCREPKGLVIPVVNLLPGWKAAAARIRVDRVEGGLPSAEGEGFRIQDSGGKIEGAGGRTQEAEGGEPSKIRNPQSAIRNRTMGFYFEDSSSDDFFGGDPALATPFETMERWARWNRYLGANLMMQQVMVYTKILWPTKVFKMTGTVSVVDTPRMLALVAEKYGQRFVPDVHVSVNMFGLDPEKDKAAFDELILRDFSGNIRCGYPKHVFNALHPKVQEKYVELIGELADNLGDSPAFDGISIRLMLGWQWAGYNALPGLKFGYEDWTVAQFEKETGIQVPGKVGDPGRFKQRFDFLTGPKKEQWIDWRCGKIFALHRRLLERIRQARPEARLYINYFGPDERYVLSGDEAGRMLEVGIAPRSYRNEPGIVLIPANAGVYGRRDSSPLNDASAIDGLLYSRPGTPSERWLGRAFELPNAYFEYNWGGEFDRIGGKSFNYGVNGACSPNDIHEREIYALALADGDSATIINGGAGWIFGNARVMPPFLREYRALPDIPFQPVETARDPVAVWQSRKSDQSSVNSDQLSVDTRNKNQVTDNRSLITDYSFFYAVNRLPVAVEAAIKMKGGVKKIFAAADGAPVKLDGDTLHLTLEPYMLKSFRAEGAGFAIAGCETKVPAEFVAKVKPIAEFCRQLSADLKAGRVAPEFNQAEVDAVLAGGLDAAVTAFDKGEYWKAWRVDSLPLVNLYTATGRFPPGMWERSVPHGLPANTAAAPKLEPAGFFGDTRGRLSGCVTMDVAPDGALWATSADKVMRFGADGRYEKHLQFFGRPHTCFGKAIALPSQINTIANLIALDKKRIGCRMGGLLFAFDAQSSRTHMKSWADGIPAGLPLAVNDKGDVVVASNDEKNRGVHKYRADGKPAYDFPGHDPLYRLCDDGANGGAVDSEGRIYLTPLSGGVKIYSAEGKELAQFAAGRKFGVMASRADGQLLVAAERATLQAFRRGADGAFAPAWQSKLEAAPSGVKFLAADRLAVGFINADTNGAVVREFALGADGASAGKALVGGFKEMEPTCLSGFTQLKTRENAVYYAAHRKIWRLAPGAERAELVFDPKWPAHLPIESFAFAPNGDLYLASHWNGGARGINLYRARKADAGYDKLEYLNGGKPLAESVYMSPTDIEVDGNGDVVIRLIDAADGKREKVHLFRWSPTTGERKLLCDLGGPFSSNYGLHRLADGGLLIAGGTTRSILRLASDGQTLWSKTFGEHYLPGAFDTWQPQGITADSQGRVWVTDTARQRIICLAADGAFLAAYGHLGTMDDRSGFGLNSPVGVATVKDAKGAEYLYVADTGNQRIAKFVIK